METRDTPLQARAWMLLLVVAGGLSNASPLCGQGRAAAQDTILAILRYSEPSFKWVAYQSARLAVQEYGREAGIVAANLLIVPPQPPQRVLLVSCVGARPDSVTGAGVARASWSNSPPAL